MSSVQIKRVETKKDLKAFIEFHYDLYEGNPSTFVKQSTFLP